MIDTLDKAALAAHLADERKAQDILVMDLRGVCNFTDAFVVCTAANRVQLNAIADGISETFKKAGMRAPREETMRESTWLVLDYGDVVVHVMSQEARTFYRLEKLWGDSKEIAWADRVAPDLLAAN